MKKLSLGLTALLFASSLMFSCKKEDSLTPGISGTNDNPPIGKLTSNWGIHRVWNASVGDCTAPAVNCFDDVVVRPKVIDDLAAVAAGGSSSVQDYFSGSNWQEPFPDLKPTLPQ